MTEAQYDVLGIGNALVDVLAHCEDAFLNQNGMNKGTMTLVDAEQAAALYDKMGSAIESSGGSAANTVAGLASLGGRAAFVGKVGDDMLGRVFRHDIQAIGSHFETVGLEGQPTGCCLVLVTPDAERTMMTFLGAATQLGPDDIDPQLVGNSAITYMEGYLWDPPAAKEAFIKAARAAHDAGRKVALSLSDPFCVERHKDSFRTFVKEHVDILCANEQEICHLYDAADFDDALQSVRQNTHMAALTRGKQGSVIVTDDEVHVIDAAPVAQVMDTTGAGDLYAAGVLFGLSRGLDLHTCGRIGSACAGEIISHMGARPETSLADLVKGIMN